MKYSLSNEIVLRREWFGCLAFQPHNGQYWQFNEDAFEILRHLKAPLSLNELQKKTYYERVINKFSGITAIR